MSRVLVLLLTLSCLANLAVISRSGPQHSTLPIFVPASLAYEQQLRQDRDQPAGQGTGREAAELVQWIQEGLQEQPLDAATRARLAPQLLALRDTRAELLEARNRRHALNVAMMQLGVALGRELTPAQWDQVHMSRDLLRAREELLLYDSLLEELR